MNKQIYKIDLHTHSTLSHDGGLSENDLKRIFQKGLLDYIAITDHNEIAQAIKLNKKFGDKVIIGEEIKTRKGEVIGLFIKDKIEPGQEIEETVNKIKAQGGLVYLPHPFDIRRSGISKANAEALIDKIDIIEVFNARNITPGGNKKVQEFNKKYKKSFAAGSDSHTVAEIGRTYTIVKAIPTKENLIELLYNPKLVSKYVSLWGFTGPRRNKLKKYING